MKRLLFLVFVVILKGVQAQTTLETNPTSLKWRQINTPNFRVIFPNGFDTQAQRMANTFEHIRQPESNTMGGTPRKISVILQNQSSISNGFVSMFPRRSEFFTMPAQNYNFLGANDWLNLLASHEYRHVVQYQNATKGFSKLFYYLFGSPTFAGMAHVAAPDWFWEGDAVATETAFTPGGRGKIPNFDLVFRTNLLSDRTFNYHKQYLRSYKHNIPNHYVLGYHMISYLRRRTNDPDIWEKISAHSWTVPFIPFRFSSSIRNKTGLTVTKLYNEMARDLQTEWQNQIDTLQFTSFENIIKRRDGTFTDYLYPQPQIDGSVIAMKQGIGTIATFVKINDGQEEKLFVPGQVNDTGMLSATATAIVWTEYGYDARWQVRDYSLIKALDHKSKKRIVVSDKHSRFAGGAISPDGKKVVTTRSGNEYKHALVILSYPDGRVEKEFENAENYFYAMPRWSDDGKFIVALKVTGNGKTISIVNPENNTIRDVMPLGDENVGYPSMHDNFIIYNSPATGIDNIFAVDLTTSKFYQLTTSKFGAYNALVTYDGSYIYYNNQTRDGMDVVRMPFDPSKWIPYRRDLKLHPSAEALIEQEAHPELFSTIPAKEYSVSKFSKFRNMINPFSWGFFVDNNNLTNITFGINSQDILSTTSLFGGYVYDINEETGFLKTGISYQGFLPIIDAEYTNGDRSVNEGQYKTVVVNENDTTGIVVNDAIFKWHEENVNVGLRLPLNFTQSKYFSGLTVSNYFGFTQVTDFDNSYNGDRFFPQLIVDGVPYGPYFLDYVGNGNLFYNYSRLSAHHLLKTSRRDILSPWGQSIDLKYYSTPYGGDYNGGLFSAVGYLYFPGIAKHHNIFGYMAYQQYANSPTEVDVEQDYYFRNTVPVPRGYSLPRFDSYYGASINYTLPLWYPDIALGPVLNIQRFRLNVFTDYGYGQSIYGPQSGDQSYTSVGGELKMDFNVMRFLPQIDLGIRFSYGIRPEVQKFEVIVGTINF